MEDGVIKFSCDWSQEPLGLPVSVELIQWRDKMHQLGLIGVYEKLGVGYGNISIKTPQGIFISGSQTGHIYPIQGKDFSLIDSYSIEKNQVSCRGEVKASSESLTHAAVYEADDTINAVIHIHHQQLWLDLMDKVPTSSKDVPYGTPQMAGEIKRLFDESTLSQDKIMVMAGHEEGIIAFGKDLEEAGAVILNLRLPQ